MDHRQFDVSGDKLEDLPHAMELAFRLRDYTGKVIAGVQRGASHYAIRAPFAGVRSEGDGRSWVYGQEPKPLRMIFFARSYPAPIDMTDRISFPFTADSTVAAEFATRWLKECEYPKEPDTDGSTKNGWRVYSERYGKIDGETSAIIAVAPLWAVYGK